MNLTGKQPYSKPDKAPPDPAYMADVAELPCWICALFGMQQLSPTQVHHVIHGRYGTRRAPDRDTIPLCEGHHQGLMDTSKIALHREPSKWKRLYGPDHSYIERTRQAVEDRLISGWL